jgi:peptide/nickel transport system permease protein
MAGFYRMLVRRSINLLLVLFLVLVLTVILLGETMDKILTDNIRQEVIGSLIESKIKFQNAQAQQAYIDDQIELRIRNLGLDEP